MSEILIPVPSTTHTRAIVERAEELDFELVLIARRKFGPTVLLYERGGDNVEVTLDRAGHVARAKGWLHGEQWQLSSRTEGSSSRDALKRVLEIMGGEDPLTDMSTMDYVADAS